VSLHIENFGGQVLGSPAEGEGLISGVLKEFCQTEICQNDVAISIHEDVFGFQVAMHHIVGVQITHGEHDLRRDELHGLFLESFDSEKRIVDVTTGHKLKEQVDPGVILEDVVH